MTLLDIYYNKNNNCSYISGDTGPLVYPAGFVYVYSLLYFITSRGQYVRLAQYIFICIYLLQLYFALRLYTKSRKIPPYVLLITTFTSYRVHSIYVLRLFNDPIAILFLYIALNLYVDGHWTWGSVFLSLGVSVKMNVLLFAPAILLLYITNLGYIKTALQLSVCAGIQLILGLPFLYTHPVEYLRGSFDIGRVFDHKWTVNYRFLPIDIFENKLFHIGLLVLHIVLLIVFIRPALTYFGSYFRLKQLQLQLQPQIDAENANKLKKKKSKKEPEILSPDQKKFLDSFESTLKKSSGGSAHPVSNPLPHPTANPPENKKAEIFFDKSVQLILLPIFLANFIGIVCARSLHYQFYVWYFHSLPYLVWYTRYSTSAKFLILGLLEMAWNVYPSTEFSSIALHTSHVLLLVGVARVLLQPQPNLEDAKAIKNH